MKRAVCNELFGERDFAESMKILSAVGFAGVELAPHTLFGDFTGDIGGKLAEVRRILDGEGLSFAGMHWLLVGPEGLHVTAADESLRRRSWDHIRRLADMSGELGGGPMTLGSPDQRASRDGLSADEATRLFSRGLASVGGHVAAAGSRLLIEALPSEFTDVVNTLAESREIIDGIASPGILGMFDFHNTDDESEDWESLIREHRGYIEHVHLNDVGGTIPRDARPEYRKAFAALDEIGYRDWVSLEIFTIPEDPARDLRQVVRFLDAMDSEE